MGADTAGCDERCVRESARCLAKCETVRPDNDAADGDDADFDDAELENDTDYNDDSLDDDSEFED